MNIKSPSGLHAVGLDAYAVPLSAAFADLTERQAVSRLWAKDAALWKAEPAHQAVIKNSLGWLTVMETSRQQAADLAAFATEVGRAGITDALLLGMGGSSLCPDVLRLTFGQGAGHLRLTVLDSTDPSTIQPLDWSLDLAHTLVIVASKSGTTPEIAAFSRYFFAKVKALLGDRAGQQFVAITDPGTPLERAGAKAGFRRIFLNAADIGGRYSALSLFGMLPAALMGVDAPRLLERADHMAQACGAAVPLQENPGAWLGAVIGTLAKAGRDKLTFICSPEIASFGTWVEQLIAESTGKDGTGIVPVEGEGVPDPAAYRGDRLFVYAKLQESQDHTRDQSIRTLEQAGHPVVTILLKDRYDLGAEFFRWEVATALAGAVLGVNPFDQPNVQESKDNTRRLLEEFKAKGHLPESQPLLKADAVCLYGDAAAATSLKGAQSLAEALRTYLGHRKVNEYVALLSYLPGMAGNAELLAAIRLAIRNRYRTATTLGYGPRYLHSTGQLHKGGGDHGIFLQFTGEEPVDLPIPGEPYSFGTMKAAQALGDLASLQSHGRRVLRLHITGPVKAGLRQVVKAAGEL